MYVFIPGSRYDSYHFAVQTQVLGLIQIFWRFRVRIVICVPICFFLKLTKFDISFSAIRISFWIKINKVNQYNYLYPIYFTKTDIYMSGVLLIKESSWWDPFLFAPIILNSLRWSIPKTLKKFSHNLSKL